MDNSERHAAMMDAKYPDGTLDYDVDCKEECHEGRHYKHGDTSSWQYILCGCTTDEAIAERREREAQAVDEIGDSEHERGRDV